MKRTIALLLIMFMIASTSLTGGGTAAAAPTNADYEEVLANYKYQLTGGAFAISQAPQNVQDAVYAAVSAGRLNWETMNKLQSRNSLWFDDAYVQPQDGTFTSAPMQLSYSRLQSMATAYAMDDGTYFTPTEKTNLRNDIVNAMDWMYANWYNTSLIPLNELPTFANPYPFPDGLAWYDMTISIPTIISSILTLMGNEFTSTQVDNYTSAILYYNTDLEYAGTRGNTLMLGGNLAEKCLLFALVGALRHDETYLLEARDKSSTLFTYAVPYPNPKDTTSGDGGFYTDGSYIQHVGLPYLGNYGYVLVNSITKMLTLISGTPWEVRDPNVVNMANWVKDTIQPAMYKGALMDLVRGRMIQGSSSNRDHDAGNNMMRTLPRVADLLDYYGKSSDAAYTRSLVKYWMNSIQGQFDVFAGALVPDILKLNEIMDPNSTVVAAQEPIFSKFYPITDIAMHARPGFGYSISMHSDHIKNFEKNDAGQNQKGWYNSDGHTYLYNNDLSQYSGNYWATVNKYRLPGTTVDTRVLQDAQGANQFGLNNEVGGATLNGYGVSAMKMTSHYAPLTAYKSWFMFDDEVVALGAGITSTDSAGVETIIENRKIKPDSSNLIQVNTTTQNVSQTLGQTTSLSGVNWLHLDGNISGSAESDIGYYFPNSPTLKMLKEQRTDRWGSVNTYIKNQLYKTITPVTDASVRDGVYGNISYVTEPTLQVENSNNSDNRSLTYLTFDLTGITSATGATLYLTGQQDAAGPDDSVLINVYGSTSLPSPLTYSNLSANASTYLGQFQANGTTQSGMVDITSFIQQQLSENGGNNQAVIMLRGDSATLDKLYIANSSEASAYKPQLVMSYDPPVTDSYETVWFDHGANPQNQSYSYVTLPGKTATQVADYSANPDIQILQNDTSAQAVKETKLNMTGINFWTDTQTTVNNLVTSNKKATVLLQESTAGAPTMDIAVSDLNEDNQGTIELEINRSAPAGVITMDPGITVTQFSPTIKLSVGVKDSFGKAYHIRFDMGTSAVMPDATPHLNDNPSVASGQVELTWSGVNHATGYKVKYGTASGTYTQTLDVSSVSQLNKLTVTGLTDGTPYYFTVSAVSGAGETGNSNEQPAIPQPIMSASVTIPVIEDGTIRNGSGVNTNNGTGNIEVKNDGTNKRNGFLKFDLSSFSGPVSNAKIALVPISNGSSCGTTNPCPVTNQAEWVTSDAWSESTLTWNNPWTSNSAPVNSTPIAQWQVPTSGRNPIYIDVTSQVQAEMAGNKQLSIRLSNPSNQGTNSQVSYAARENANSSYRPVLILNEPNAYAVINDSADATIRGGTYADTALGSGTVLDVKKESAITSSGNRNAYLKFDVSSITGSVTSAKIVLVPTHVGVSNTTCVSSTGVSTNACVVNQAQLVTDDSWTESTLTWNNQVPGYNILGSWTVENVYQPVTLDVTNAVQAVLAGDKVLSIMISAPNYQGGAAVNSYGSRGNANPAYRPMLVIN